LTTQEYQLLEDHFRDSQDPTKIRYFDFNERIEGIFTSKNLEKEPTQTLSHYSAPSILDAKVKLTPEEEEELAATMIRIGTDVKHRRLLIKPFF
jgi:hypothetical protein